MTVQYHNVNVGVKHVDGSYMVTGTGRSTSQSGDVTIAYNDATVTDLNKLRAGVAQALLVAAGDSALAKG